MLCYDSLLESYAAPIDNGSFQLTRGNPRSTKGLLVYVTSQEGRNEADHKRREIQAGSRPAKYHVARDL